MRLFRYIQSPNNEQTKRTNNNAKKSEKNLLCMKTGRKNKSERKTTEKHKHRKPTTTMIINKLSHQKNVCLCVGCVRHYFVVSSASSYKQFSRLSLSLAPLSPSVPLQIGFHTILALGGFFCPFSPSCSCSILPSAFFFGDSCENVFDFVEFRRKKTQHTITNTNNLCSGKIEFIQNICIFLSIRNI